MKNNVINIFICGMGGQGIGFLSKILTESCLEAGNEVIACDTHGMAQRGGIVVAHIRVGSGALAPMIPVGGADIIVGMERLEALRGMLKMIKPGGVVFYYDVAYHPVIVRIGGASYPDEEELVAGARKTGAVLERIHFDDLSSPKLQNMVLLGSLVARQMIPGLTEEVVARVIARLLPEALKGSNLEILRRVIREKRKTRFPDKNYRCDTVT